MKTRPRGFIEYTPRRDALQLIETVKRILKEYVDILPLTLRQIFYLLVSHYGFEKTEAAYKNTLIETMNKARRGRLIPMDAIRDDGFTETQAEGWKSAKALLQTFKWSAENFTLDRQRGQERRLKIWCEAAGMVPQLQRVADDYSIQVCSSGGFDSLTTKHTMGESLADNTSVEILHIGDHDPSGVHMFSSLEEDIQAFAEWYSGDIKFTRLAVTPRQIALYDLPQAPPKDTDRRSFSGLTTQAEALDPRVLAEILREAIEDRLDMDVYQKVLDREKVIKTALVNRLKKVFKKGRP